MSLVASVLAILYETMQSLYSRPELSKSCLVTPDALQPDKQLAVGWQFGRDTQFLQLLQCGCHAWVRLGIHSEKTSENTCYSLSYTTICEHS
jgi:hypothetical protein